MDILKVNPFEYNEQDSIIACVGDNGGTDDISIKDGFKSTVYILFENINQGGTEDELIYPLIYCCRHSIELTLKIIINNIERIEKQKSKSINASSRIKALHSHSIQKLDELLKRIASIDRRIADSYSQISPLLVDYFFDFKGDAFKYTQGFDGKEILKANKIGSISITVLKEKFTLVMTPLDALISDSGHYVQEYSCGVFTEHLSRADIETIAAKLPHHDKWREDSFDAIRAELREEYGISNKELSKAIDLIKRHQSFGAKIGFEHQLGSITDEELCAYAKYLHAIDTDDEVLSTHTIGSFSMNDLKYMQRQHKIISDLTDCISTDSIQFFAAFCYMGKQYSFYVEKFDYVLMQYTDDIVRSWLLKKISNKSYALRGMELCGQATYKEKLLFYLAGERIEHN